MRAHFVQFYETDPYLLDTLSDFIGTALGTGDAAIVVATPDHRTGLEERLQADGLDIAAAVAHGQYISLDARQTLTLLMVDGRPDPQRFEDIIGGIVARAALGGLQVRIFGEMVGLLAMEGNRAAAVRLEELWNGLQAKRPFTLFCAYPVEALDDEALGEALSLVCDTHSAVFPTERYTSLLTADERLRAITLLQEKARRLEREIAVREAAEQALRDEREITETLARIGSGLTATLDSEALVQAVADAATKVSGAAFGAFLQKVTNQRGESYRLATISGAPKEAFAHFPMPCNTAIFGPTFRGDGRIRLDDVTRDPRYGRTAPYHGMPPGHLAVRSYLAVPVYAGSGEVLGGLFFGHPEPGVFTERSERLVAGIASWAAIALENAQLYRDALAAVHVRDEFLAAVSHDLRTPLTTIRGMTQLARRQLQRLATAPTEQIAGSLNVVDRAAGKTATMVDDLLDLSRLQSGRPLELNRQPVDLVALVQQLVAEHQQGAPTHQLRLAAGWTG